MKNKNELLKINYIETKTKWIRHLAKLTNQPILLLAAI